MNPVSEGRGRIPTFSLVLAAALTALFAGCSGLPPNRPPAASRTAALDRALEPVRATHAPDPHLGLFHVGVACRGDTMVLTGEVASASARADALAAARAAGLEVDDRIAVLPDPALGEATWGLVCLSVVTGREQPEHKAEVGTQELMGRSVRIWKRSGIWSLVQTADRYVSWMEEGSFQRCTASDVEAWNRSALLMVTAFEDRVLERPDPGAQPVSDVVMGCLVRALGETGDWYRVDLPDHRSGYLPRKAAEDYAAWRQSRKASAENVERAARLMLGRPYLWGGSSPRAFDCSGFTKFVFFLNGIGLDRNASHQARQGAEIPLDSSLSALEKGDLLFFGRRAGNSQPERVTHTGIYLGDRLFIHASERVRINSLDPTSPIRDERRIHTLIRARRLLPPES